MPELRPRERGKPFCVLVLRGRDRAEPVRGRPQPVLGDLALPHLPRVERHVPAVVLVVRERALGVPEAARLGRQCTPRYNPPSIWTTLPDR